MPGSSPPSSAKPPKTSGSRTSRSASRAVISWRPVIISTASGAAARTWRRSSSPSGPVIQGLSARTWKPASCSRRIVASLRSFRPASTTTSPGRSATRRSSDRSPAWTVTRQPVGRSRRWLNASTSARKSSSSGPFGAWTTSSSRTRGCRSPQRERGVEVPGIEERQRVHGLGLEARHAIEEGQGVGQAPRGHHRDALDAQVAQAGERVRLGRLEGEDRDGEARRPPGPRRRPCGGDRRWPRGDRRAARRWGSTRRSTRPRGRGPGRWRPRRGSAGGAAAPAWGTRSRGRS